jgi:hypothetical protein
MPSMEAIKLLNKKQRKGINLNFDVSGELDYHIWNTGGRGIQA